MKNFTFCAVWFQLLDTAEKAPPVLKKNKKNPRQEGQCQFLRAVFFISLNVFFVNGIKARFFFEKHIKN